MSGRMMSNGVTVWAVCSWSGKRQKHQDLNCLFATLEGAQAYLATRSDAGRHVIQAWAVQMWVDA